MKKYNPIKIISEVAYNFLNDFEPEKYEDGRFEIGKGVYCNIESYQTKTCSRFEVHRKYIDIQYVISGDEKIILSDRDDICGYIEEEYSSDRDIAFYRYAPELATREKVLSNGDFLVIMPGIYHMPCIIASNRINVRKMVIKIPCERNENMELRS